MRDNENDDKTFGEEVANVLSGQKAETAGEKPSENPALMIARNTCVGDVRDFLLDRLKTFGKPWVAMSQDEQADQIHAAKNAASFLVQRVVEIVAAEGKKAMKGKLKNFTNDGSIIKCVITLPKEDEQRHELMDAAGCMVLLVLADSHEMIGERGPAEPTPNQTDLITEAEKLKKSDKKVTSIRKKKED